MNEPNPFGFDPNEAGLPAQKEGKRPLLEHISGDDYALRIDNSMLEVFETCPRSAEYYAVNRRQAPPSAALAFGGAIHEGLAILYKQGFTRANLAEAIDATTNYLLKNPVAPDQWRTPELACDILREYFDKYELTDPIKPIMIEGEIGVERRFSLALGVIDVNAVIDQPVQLLTNRTDIDIPDTAIKRIHVLWTGRMDIACTHLSDVISVCDHKTSSMGGPTFFQDFQLSQQTHGYCWAVSKLIGKPVTSFILNAIIQRKPSRTGKNLTLERQFYKYEEAHLQEWERDVMAHVENFVHCLYTNYFPKNTKWCMGKYGRCQYHDICTLPPEQRLVMLNSSLYQNVSWSPLL